MKKILSIASLTALCASAHANDGAEREAVLGVIDAFVESLTTRDVDRMRTLMTPDGIIYGYREDEQGVQIIRPTHADYLDNLATGEARLVERFWDPDVMVYGRLATIWTPYDLYADGEYSHCGVNNFSLLKTDAGWVITGVVFSIEAECAPSPLGPFEDNR